MRKRAEWMKSADEKILDALQGGLMLGPTTIAKNVDLSRSYVSRRLSILIAYGLIKQVEEGYYQITDQGKKWLEGDLDASDLEPSVK